MAFWENMKVWQMGRLLQERTANPETCEIWLRWKNRIQEIPPRQYSTSDQLSDQPKVPAAYFLAFVAVLCEKDKKVPCLEIDYIDRAYLADIFDSSNDWMKSIIWVLPYIESSREERRAACWSRILNYTTGFLHMGIHAQTTLIGLLHHIQEINAEAADAHEERVFPQESIDNFTHIMDEFDESWQHLASIYAAPNPTVETLCSLIQNGIRQIILTGAPGTGKTYAAAKAARKLNPCFPIQIAQFHPSYDYTDFVEGLRPVQLKGETKSTFVRLDGSFKAFCRRVAEENRRHASEGAPSERLYFFLIDEINRANLSQVFGELMFCLESDKRDQPVQTQYRNLPTYRIDENQKAEVIEAEQDVFSDGFFIPQNVVILGTMNDIDRSVESMDFALRRRFIWHEVKVDHMLLKTAFQSGNFGRLLQENAEEAAELVTRLNTVIENSASFGLSRHYDISQGQFNLPCPEAKTLGELLLFVWKHRIEPLLREYVRGETQKEVEAFIQKCARALEITDQAPADSAAVSQTDDDAQEED